MANLNQIHPEVDAVIKPIIYDMTRIDIAQRTNPLINSHNEPDAVKEIKKSCVHLVFEDNEYKIAAAKNTNNELVCRMCGRTINTKFDESSIKKITDAIEVVNQVVLFGTLNGLKAQPIQTLISIKQKLPAVAQLVKELNEYVKKDNTSNDTFSNIGKEYQPGALRSITSF